MTLFNRVALLDVELKDGTAVRVEGLRIVFEALKTRTQATNTGKVAVFNLSEQTRNSIREKDALVRLQAGYIDDTRIETLFVGNAAHILHQRLPPDIVTEIELQDGVKDLREVRFGLSFAENTPANTVINDIIRRMGITRRYVENVPGRFVGGYSYNGTARGALNEVCNRFALEWSIQNGEIQIVKKGQSTNETAVLLTPETGLIHAPERNAYTDGDLEGASTNEPEWKFTSLLNPRLVPGGKVEVESRTVVGTFIIDTVRHYGDTRGSEFFSEVEVRGI